MALNRDVVLDAAVTLLDEVGLDDLSTRRLADALGVRVGALYWHYPGKQALLDAIAERILGEAMAAPVPESGWDRQVRAFAHAHRDAMLAHPDGARVVAGMTAPGPVAKAFIRRPIDALTGVGLNATHAEGGADVITSYVNGFTIEEQARKTTQPRAARDAAFEVGLTVIINGLRTLR